MKKNISVNSVNTPEIKIVRVSKETHDRLGKFGRKEESYGDIVSRLLDIAEGVI